MTDVQLILGIQSNNPIVWRYICRNLKSPFIATLKRISINASLSNNDWEDIFQESCMILMENVKHGKFEIREGSVLFSYFVEIGKRTMQAALRKINKHHPIQKQNEDSPHIIQLWAGPTKTIAEENNEIFSTEEKQKEQDKFLDRVFDSIPDACKILLKKFYWDHRPMDEIACMLGLRNADTAKTKKNRCMNKFKEIAEKLVESGEYAEEVVRACVERAALCELLEDERILMSTDNVRMASLKIEDEDKSEDK